MKSEEIIIFQHLAKTAGSTLAEILIRNLPMDQQLAIVPDERVSALGTWSIDLVHEALRNLTPTQLEKVRFTGGHVGFGIHNFLPKPARYVAIVRDPVDRVVSGFFYSLAAHIKTTGERVSLREYVFRKRHYDLGLNNGLTRVLSGIPALDPFGPMTTGNTLPITEEDFEITVKNIRDHYLLIGTTERFDEFLVVLARALGWSLTEILYTRRNITKDRPSLSELPGDLIKEISIHNLFDERLFLLANDLLDRAIDGYGENFEEQVHLFREMNKSGATI